MTGAQAGETQATKIRGYGNTVKVTGCIGAGDYQVSDQPARTVAWSAHLKAPDGTGMAVHAVRIGETWHIGVGLTSADRSLPAWQTVYKSTESGNVQLAIYTPHDTRLAAITPFHRLENTR